MAEVRVRLGDHINEVATSQLALFADRTPWALVAEAPAVVRALLETLSSADYVIDGDIALHRSATVEAGAVLKGPLIVGPRGFIATGAYLRGGNWLDADCLVGPDAELKASFLFAGTKLAHFNFVGESVDGTLHDTGVQKFGALVGGGCRIGANAVVAPGAVLRAGQVVQRASLLDQEVLVNPT